DMRSIDVQGRMFDFTWSSCAVEHLGSISYGTKFLTDQARLLKPGGIAVHTVEFTLFNEHVEEDSFSCMWEYLDIIRLKEKLKSRAPRCRLRDVKIRLEDDLDFYVDVSPFDEHRHLKLLLHDRMSTSLLIVIQC